MALTWFSLFLLQYKSDLYSPCSRLLNFLWNELSALSNSLNGDSKDCYFFWKNVERNGGIMSAGEKFG